MCGLPAQHQPSLGAPLLIHSAPTRRSPQRDASSDQPSLRAIVSGMVGHDRVPSSIVSGERPAARIETTARRAGQLRVYVARVDVDGW